MERKYDRSLICALSSLAKMLSTVKNLLESEENVKKLLKDKKFWKTLPQHRNPQVRKWDEHVIFVLLLKEIGSSSKKLSCLFPV